MCVRNTYTVSLSICFLGSLFFMASGSLFTVTFFWKKQLLILRVQFNLNWNTHLYAFLLVSYKFSFALKRLSTHSKGWLNPKAQIQFLRCWTVQTKKEQLVIPEHQWWRELVFCPPLVSYPSHHIPFDSGAPQTLQQWMRSLGETALRNKASNTCRAFSSPADV